MTLIKKYMDMDSTNEFARPSADFDDEDYFKDHYPESSYNWEDDSTQMPREQADELLHTGDWKKLLGDMSEVDDPDFSKNVKPSIPEENEEEEESDSNRDPIHIELEDLLVSFYNMNDVDKVSAKVDSREVIHIYIMPKKYSSTLDEIQNILDISNKAAKNILVDYYPEFDLWETTSKNTRRDEPLITISFYKDKESSEAF
jgi:hypothetical protein